MTASGSILCRRYVPGETPGEREFLAKSWVESFSSSDLAKLVTFQGICPSGERAPWKPSDEYWAEWNRMVNALLEEERVDIAVDKDYPLTIAGFCCWELVDAGPRIHYLYVRQQNRRRGIARALVNQLPSGPVTFTHRSRSVHKIPEGWRYVPPPIWRGRRAA